MDPSGVIRGYFSSEGGRQRPFVDAIFQFPTLENRVIGVPLLVDSGADRTVLAPRDALRMARTFGIELNSLPLGAPSTGVGGSTSTRLIEAEMTVDNELIRLPLTILEPSPGAVLRIPSLLGRDVISRFALFMEERTRRVLLLAPGEADSLRLPG